ncbi:1-deoxy-D-xylulose-5-phosphate synthase [candidate division TA06 bacterium]|nr:1-deoxy-D-xylulose-5-phosphate synthase [candidate division TA06 bacterium]
MKKSKFSVLDRVETPKDLKGLSTKELEQLAGDLREYMVPIVKETGGHFAPNLGVVELTLALHSVYDTPRDILVWDIGHQAYFHKIITGRKEAFQRIRQFGGISGFLKREESPYDTFGAGHASTAIAAAMGFAVARDLKEENYKVVTVIGDGALTGGLAYEGLNNAGAQKTDILVILNDNRMAISPNVGAISQYLTGLTTNPIYNRFKKEIWKLTEKMPGGKETVRAWVHRAEESLKGFLVPGMLFEELGFRYFGPIDGNDLKELVSILKRLKRLRGPNLLHVLTVKGKGVKDAEKDPVKFYALKGAVKPKATLKQKTVPSYSEVLVDALIKMAEKNSRVCVITAAMAEGTGLVKFEKKYPDRFFDVGIAESYAVTFSGGLAANGLRPVAAIYSTFLQRSFDQILHDIALQNLPVVFCLDRAGLVGPDGPTHHGVFDLSYLSCLPGMILSAPKDGDELRNLLHTAISYERGPFVIRYPKDSAIRLSTKIHFQPIKIGSWEELEQGEDLVILAVGSMVEIARSACQSLREKGVYPGLVNCRFVKPLDEEQLLDLANRYPSILTIEENVLQGGFGCAVANFLKARHIQRNSLHHLGIPDRFVDHGPRELLLDLVGLSSNKIANTVEEKLMVADSKILVPSIQ